MINPMTTFRESSNEPYLEKLLHSLQSNSCDGLLAMPLTCECEAALNLHHNYYKTTQVCKTMVQLSYKFIFTHSVLVRDL